MEPCVGEFLFAPAFVSLTVNQLLDVIRSSSDPGCGAPEAWMRYLPLAVNSVANAKKRSCCVSAGVEGLRGLFFFGQIVDKMGETGKM
jgi:hypothetical protein